MNRKRLLVNNDLIKKLSLLALSTCVTSLVAFEPDEQMKGADLPAASAASSSIESSSSKWAALVLPFAQRILGAFQGQTNSQIDPYIANAIAELRNSGSILGGLQKEADDAVRAERTLLTPSNWIIGAYASDLKKVPLILLDIGANKLFNDKLLQERKAFILKDFKENTNKLIETIESVTAFQIQWEEQAAVRGGMGYQEKAIFDQHSAALLTQYGMKHHCLFGYILPHEKRTYVPLILKYIWDKTSTSLHKNLITQDKYLDGCHSSDSAYKPDATGTLRRESYTPFSLATVLGFSYKFIKNPFTTLLTANYSWMYLGGKNAHKPFPTEANTMIGRIMNSALGLGMPDSYYSQNGQRVVEFLILMFTAQFVDNINSLYWDQHLKLQRHALLRYLKKYRAAHDAVTGSVEKLKKAEAKLKKFIDEGHKGEDYSHGALEGRWAFAAQLAPLRFAHMTGAYTIAVLAARGCMSQNEFVRKWSALILAVHLSWQGVGGVLQPVLPIWAARTCALSVFGFFLYGYYRLLRSAIEQANPY